MLPPLECQLRGLTSCRERFWQPLGFSSSSRAQVLRDFCSKMKMTNFKLYHLEQTMKTTDILKATMSHSLFPLAFLAVLFFIPHAMIVVCPAYFAAQLSLFPDRYRSRRGFADNGHLTTVSGQPHKLQALCCETCDNCVPSVIGERGPLYTTIGHAFELSATPNRNVDFLLKFANCSLPTTYKFTRNEGSIPFTRSIDNQ